MNKVTTINLNGKAYQLEEAGYDLFKKYLQQAAKKLQDDPDKDEILADFERTIAEKCDGYLHARKNVITEKEVQKIIDDMGPVEPAEEAEHAEDKSEASVHARRLYALREGSIICGVANGLATYLNVDVTIVRLVFVLLIFPTSGLMILIYLILALILPVAETPEQKAELRGERFSAQDVLDRAKRRYADLGSKDHWQKVAEDSRPALSGIGDLLQKCCRIASVIIGVCFGVALGFLTAAWISGLWWLAFGHLHLADQLSTISLWTIAMGMTAAYFIAALPLGVLTNFFIRLGANRSFGKQSVRWLVAIVSLWVIAVGVLAGAAAVTSGRISQYQSTHGYVTINGHSICINDKFCPGNVQPMQSFPDAPFPPSHNNEYRLY